MKTKFNRFAFIPFHCTDCHRFIWFEKYRKASVQMPIYFPVSYMKKKICCDCISKYDIKEQGK